MVLVIQRNIFIPHDDRTGKMSGSTLGILWSPGNKFSCWTVERPWINNKPRISCIPEGHYKIKYVDGLGKKGAEWVVQDVPGRWAIEFHVANRSSELAGCIALGDRPYMFGKELGVTQSTTTTALFNEMLKPFRNSEVDVLIFKGNTS